MRRLIHGHSLCTCIESCRYGRLSRSFKTAGSARHLGISFSSIRLVSFRPCSDQRLHLPCGTPVPVPEIFRVSHESVPPPANPFPDLVFLSFPTTRFFCCIRYNYFTIVGSVRLGSAQFSSVQFSVHPCIRTCSTQATANLVGRKASAGATLPARLQGFLPETNINTLNLELDLRWRFCCCEKSIVNSPWIRVITNPLPRVSSS